ncbi:MAG: hypothetical protein R2827_07075 [Bdellovibrionales bacterium]
MKQKALAKQKTEKYAEEIKDFKMKAEKYRMQAEDNEKSVRKYKAQLERLEEEHALSKQELANARDREKQSAKMLAEMKATNAARAEKLKMERDNNQSSAKRSEKRSLANLREAQAMDANASLPKDSSGMQVDLKKSNSNSSRPRLVSLKTDCNLRSKPSGSSSKMKTLSRGEKVFVKKYKSSWYRSYDSKTKQSSGFISRGCF